MTSFLGLRQAIELTWPWHLGPVSVAHVLGAGLALAMAWRAFATPRPRAETAVAMAWYAVLALGLARADDPGGGLRQLAVLGVPPLAWLAASSDPGAARRHVGTFLAVAAIPVAVALGTWAFGTPEIEHGVARNLGPYANVHNHAYNAALTVVLAGTLAVRPGRWRAPLALLAVAALAALWSTHVRSAVAFVGLFALAWAPKRVLPLALVGAAALVAMDVDRWREFGAALFGIAPAGGWEALGTHRVAIWRDSGLAFADRSTVEQILGLGLGDHLGFWKPIDPHSEPLRLLYELGLPGVVLWHLAALHGTWLAHRLAADDDPDRAELGRLARALGIAAIAIDLVTNAFVARPTPAIALWALLGAAARVRGRMPR